jgi:hypothetical protein
LNFWLLFLQEGVLRFCADSARSRVAFAGVLDLC